MSKWKRDGTLLQGQEPGIIVEQDLVLSDRAFPNRLVDPLGLEQLEL